MAPFIIDSIGFSATHAVAELLRRQKGKYVVHGSQNFKEKGEIGSNNQSVPNFISQMLEADKHYKDVIAIHCIFDASEVEKEIKGTGVKFYGLCRRDIGGQVLSGYFWAVKKFLVGDVAIGGHVIAILEKHAEAFSSLKLAPNYKTALMFYSLQRVVTYTESF